MKVVQAVGILFDVIQLFRDAILIEFVASVDGGVRFGQLRHAAVSRCAAGGGGHDAFAV